MILFLLSVTVALVVSFLCSLAEAVLLSLNNTRLETLKQKGKTHAAIWLNMKKHVDRPIAAILILNTVAHTGGATIAGSAFDEAFGEKWIWAFSIIFTVLVLFGTEIAPKVIGVAYSQKLAPFIAGPLLFVIKILSPFLIITEYFSRLFRPKKGGAMHGNEEDMDTSDLITLARLAKTRSLIESHQEQIIVNAAKMRDLKVRNAMLPADEIILFDIHKSTADNLQLARQTLHTRYPVSETASPDGIIGYVNLKEIFSVPPEERSQTLDPYLRGVLFIDPDISVNQAIQALTSRRQHIAVVRDSKRKICGLLTMEDVLQEIVGDYEDELDLKPADFVKLEGGRWQVGSGVTLQTVQENTGFQVSEQNSKQLLGDWLTGVLPHPIRQGSSVQYSHWKITVQLMRRGEPHRILIEKLG